MQGILRKINKDKEVTKDLLSLFRKEKPEELLEYILTYADSVDNDNPDDTRAERARELYNYLNNNKDGLLPYNSKKRNIILPEASEGIIYKGMGVQENQNCTLITLRMKCGRMRWSETGGNAMVKVLTAEANGILYNYVSGILYVNENNNTKPKGLSAAKVPQYIGNKNFYPDLISKTMPMLRSALDNGIKAIKNLCMA